MLLIVANEESLAGITLQSSQIKNRTATCFSTGIRLLMFMSCQTNCLECFPQNIWICLHKILYLYNRFKTMFLNQNCGLSSSHVIFLLGNKHFFLQMMKTCLCYSLLLQAISAVTEISSFITCKLN